MASVNFLLSSKTNKDGTRLIMLYFSYKGQSLKFSLDKTIHPDNWDNDLKKAKAKHPGFSDLNHFLARQKSEFIKVFVNRELQGLSIAPHILKEDFKQILNPAFLKKGALDQKTQNVSFIDFIESHIKKVSFVKSPKTISIYRRSCEILRLFETKIWHQKIFFDDITIDFYYKWKEFVIKEFEFTNNTINKHTGLLKLFLSEAARKRLHSNIIFTDKDFTTPRVPSDSIYLSETEIIELLRLDLSNNERLEKVRDLFVIGCKTGLRFSDLTQLTDNVISKDLSTIHISYSIKTGGSIDIPIHETVATIFKKYKAKTGFYSPAFISNQKMNDYLKEIGRLAGFDDNITISKKSGHNLIKKVFKKYELISTHTARRSFATNEYLKGTPPYFIMAITNHKTEKAFLTYIKITQSEYAKKLGEMWKSNNK